MMIPAVYTFAQMTDAVVRSRKECEILIPMADSSSALRAVEEFLRHKSKGVSVRLLGDPSRIQEAIKTNGLENLSGCCGAIDSAKTPDEALHRLPEFLDPVKDQIILKGNITTDRLLRGLLQNKEQLLRKNAIVTHMRLFEIPGKMALMGDGGINVLSNIPDEGKRAKAVSSIHSNHLRVLKLLGNTTPQIFQPVSCGGIDSLENCFIENHGHAETFPDILEFSWIGPANILYKAAAVTPWKLSFLHVVDSGTSGRISLFTRDDKQPLFLITPEAGAAADDRIELIEKSGRFFSDITGKEAKAALLDFTEQYEAFPDTPSIQESRYIVDHFRQSGGLTVEGPMAYDLAVSAKAAQTKGYESVVAGSPDILVTPDYVSGTLLKIFYTRWDSYRMPWPAADISMGGRIPILAASRSDSPDHKFRSIISALYLTMMDGTLED